MNMYVQWIVLFILVTGVIEIEARIYKWKDATGQIHYSDHSTEAAQEIYINVPTPSIAEPENQSIVAYSTLEIVQPESNQTINTNTGEVTVSLLLEPALQSEHAIQFALDDSLTSIRSSNTQIILRPVALGTHKLYAIIIDATGQTLMQSQPIVFHVRKEQSTIPP